MVHSSAIRARPHRLPSTGPLGRLATRASSCAWASFLPPYLRQSVCCSAHAGRSRAIRASSVISTHHWCTGAPSARFRTGCPRRGLSGASPLVRLRARGRASYVHLRGRARVAQPMRAVVSPPRHHPPPQRTAGASKRHLRAPSSQPLAGASRELRHSCVFVRVGEPAASISEAGLVLLSSHEL